MNESMRKQKKHLFQDVLLLIISIGFAVYMVKSGLAHELIAHLDGLSWLGIIIAGIFFTSIFTTAPAIAILGTFAETTSLPVLVVLGGIGAVLGDYVLYLLVRDRVTKDFQYLLSFSRMKRFPAIFRTRLFKFFVPFIGALVIASPFPDEIGVAMLGASKVKSKMFFLISFLANSGGIFVIGWIAKRVVEL